MALFMLLILFDSFTSHQQSHLLVELGLPIGQLPIGWFIVCTLAVLLFAVLFSVCSADCHFCYLQAAFCFCYHYISRSIGYFIRSAVHRFMSLVTYVMNVVILR